MPPGAAKISESDRLLVANWIDERLRTSGCTTGGYAGFVASRRLNRREWKNTIRDLFGLDVVAPDLFPADEAGGAGFDTNGETLYVPPMLLERYMEAATTVLDRIIVTPPFNRAVLSHVMTPVTAPPTGIKPSQFLNPGAELSTSVSVFAEGPYGVPVGSVTYGRDAGGGHRSHGARAAYHHYRVVNGSERIEFYSLTVDQRPAEK